MKSRLSRRRFMHGLATVGGAAFVGPYVLRAAEPNKEKLRVAFVATAGRADGHVGDHLNAAKAGKEMCPCYCDVDKNRWVKIAKGAPDAKGYTDWRQMFDKHEKEFDAVFVATPDHSHAVATMRAIKAGKHVYTEKPLTWCVSEARALAEAAATAKVATQMGNQGHANGGNRRIVEWVRGGVIGDVLEVHTWTNRPVWPQGIAERPPESPVPANLDWESWIGPATPRPYSAQYSKEQGEKEGAKGAPYHSFAWRGWFEFGCGDIGDMGCHTWDNVFWSTQPDYPTTVELLKSHPITKETYPKQSVIRWTFPAKGSRPGFVAYWYSGGMKPPVPEEMLNDPYYQPKAKKGEEGKPPKKVELDGSGNLYIGTKGKLYVRGDYGDSPRLIPETFMESTREAREKLTKIAPSPGHRAEFILAARGEKPYDFPGSNFAGYSGPLTEVMLLGAVVVKMGQEGGKIECDPTARKVLTPAAQEFLVRKYRQGWELA